MLFDFDSTIDRRKFQDEPEVGLVQFRLKGRRAWMGRWILAEFQADQYIEKLSRSLFDIASPYMTSLSFQVPLQGGVEYYPGFLLCIH